jgi:hypothetical protein
MVAAIDVAHRVKSYHDSWSAVIPQRTEGLIMKIAEVMHLGLLESLRDLRRGWLNYAVWISAKKWTLSNFITVINVWRFSNNITNC